MRSVLPAARRQLVAGERAQVLTMAALLAPVLLGMVGLSVDLGGYASDRRSLQNAADSIALAAAQDLPNESATLATAHSWAVKNDIDPADMAVNITGGNTAPKVKVSLHHTHHFAFMNALHINEIGVDASAAAQKASYGGSSGVVPWSITQATVDAAAVGALVTLKYDATGGNIGNFGAIRIDGSGASVYQRDVTYGSTSYICAVSAPHCAAGACPDTYPERCAETSPTCDGPECTPQTGNMVGPTRVGVDYRVDHTTTACDTFAEAFGSPNAAGVYHLNNVCNPWGAGACPNPDTTPPTTCSRRVIVIPVVDAFGNGASATETIQRFALLYLEGYDSGHCNGNNCEIKGRFVKADLTAQALAGSYDEHALVHFARLTE